MDNKNPIDSSVLMFKKKRSIMTTVERRDPLLDEISDNRKIQSFFKKYPVYPYSGTNENSSRELMSFFRRMLKLSHTEGAVVKSIAGYVLGDGVVVEKIDDEFIDLEDSASVDESIKSSFKEMVRSGKISEKNLTEFASVLFTNWKATGDYFFMLILKETLGVRSFELKVIDNEHIMYLIDERKNPIDTFAISPVWEEKYLKENPPLIVDKYPVFTEFTFGVKATVFHTKNGGNRHGRPDSIEATLSKYAEFQNMNYRIKQTDNAWAGDLIIEMESADPENQSGIGNEPGQINSTKFEQEFTNKGENPLSAFITERPPKAGPMFVYQVKPNSRESFYKVIGEVDRDNIIAAHNWSSRLLGRVLSGGLSDNVYLDELRTKIPMIKKLRKMLLYDINRAFVEIANYINPELSGYGINFYSKLLTSVESMEVTSDPGNVIKKQESAIDE